MTGDGAHWDREGAEDLEAIYVHLIARRDLTGLDDDQALEHIGKLTDLSGDLRRREGLEQAVRLSEELCVQAHIYPAPIHVVLSSIHDSAPRSPWGPFYSGSYMRTSEKSSTSTHSGE